MRAYLDHASTSPLRPAALEAMSQWLSAADPGRVHTEGRMARVALEEARAVLASFFGTRPRQVVFTSGATESISSATFGALRAGAGRGEAGAAGPGPAGAAVAGAVMAGAAGAGAAMAGAAVVRAEVEHSAVREASDQWASDVLVAGVDRHGRISVDDTAAILASRPEVRLVHCQMANHEVGTLQPVEEIAAVCRSAGVMLHVDAAAAAGHLEVAFDQLGVDLLSVSAHKMGGPAGVGALLVRRGLRIPPLLVGGSQERARRGGMENVAGAAGFAAVAALLDGGGVAEEAGRQSVLIERLRSLVLSVPGVTAYGPPSAEARLPNLLCIGIQGVEAEPVLVGLDRAGVAVHSGSSCSSETLEPSPVLAAMGVDGERSLRFSVGWSTTGEDVEKAGVAFERVVADLRRLATGA